MLMRVVLSILSTMLTFAAPALGQAILGSWQGTLPIQKDPRIVLKISPANNGSLLGSITFIDHDPVAVPLLSVTFLPPDIKFAVGGVTYRGKISSDGKSLTGVWTQGTQTYSMTFVLSNPDSAWTYSGSSRLSPMSATADPAFEVATIKMSHPSAGHATFETRHRLFEAKNATTLDLIKFAYHLSSSQVQDSPSWTTELRFDVVGQSDTEGLPNPDQHRLMVKKFLAERFHLAVHETHPIFPVYALSVANSHPSLTASSPNAGDAGIIVSDKGDGTTALQFVFTTIPELDDHLMYFIKERQIVDETGLIGRFNLTLTIPSDVLNGSSVDESERSAALFKAVRAVGFQLEPKKEPLLVIDHIEKPTPN
jgi:uncharacterized protein (TIGR03435 family)